MPEQQASPSSSRPPSTSDNNQQSQRDATAPPPAESSKRAYLSLLPPPQLIDLILAIDANRQTTIFPCDLESAIKALQRPHGLSQPPSPNDTPSMSVIVKPEPTPHSVPPPLPLPPQQGDAPPTQAPVVQPPQYKPPTFKQPPHQHMHPYTHTPYYPPPQPPQPQTPIPPPLPPPALPTRHPLFTSTPLTRDPNKPPVARPTGPPVVSSRDDPNAMPSYEEMIVEAIMDVRDMDGTAPKVLFAWMASHYPLQQNFRPSASQALHKALKRGRLEKIGGKYRLNPTWGGGPTTSKRATRRPTANRAISPPAPRSQSGPVGSAPVPPPGYAHAHPPYGYAPYAHHSSLPPHPYGPTYAPSGTAWSVGPPQPPLHPVNGANVSAQADDMEDDEGLESEDIEARELGVAGGMDVEEAVDEKMKEQTRQSLVRLARVLRRFARKGEGTGITI